MKKKAIALFTLIVTLFSIFSIAACDKVKDAEEEERVDLYGIEFKIMQIASMTTGKNDPMFYLEGTKVADLVLERLEEIGTRYNCTISIEYPDSDDKATDTLIANLALGDAEYSFVSSGKSNKIFDLAESECLYPLLEVNDVLEYGKDTFDIYGTPNLLEPAMYKGQLYMITPFAHPGKQLRSGSFIAFRDDIVTDATGLDLREYSEKGLWTWKAFEDTAKLCTVFESGVATLTGVSAGMGDFVEEAMLSNGMSFIQQTDSGYAPAIRSNNIIEALQWVKMLYDDMGDYVVFEGQSKGIEKLAAGNAAMLFVRAQAVKNEVAYAVSNFGIVPFPYGPQGDPDTNDTPVFIEGIGIFAMAEDPSVCAMILKDYCQPFADYPDRNSLYEEDSLLLWDERDLNVMLKAAERGSFDYYPCDGTKISLKATDQISYLSPANLVESYSDILEEVVKEYVIPNKELIDRLLGE